MKRLLATLAMFLILCLNLSAHAVPTHINITKAALQYLSNQMARPDALLLQLKAILVDGSANEDAFLPGYPRFPFFLGRFYFHFLPTLNDVALGQSASCDSIFWGIFGDVCTATATNPGNRSSTVQNGRTWQDALADADPNSHAPTVDSWNDLGYVIHLLEDLTSPPHTRNSAHPCILGLFYCDPFEPDNRDAPVQLPLSRYIDFSTATSPQDFFTRLRDYTRDNYFSARTVFDGNGGINLIPRLDDDEYFYGYCPQASVDFGTCDSVLVLRRIAHKNRQYKQTLNMRDAEIDETIAHEQFSELGPVAVQAVAEFIKFYAPSVTVSTDGTAGGSISSSPSGIDCGPTCSALFLNGTSVQLTASVPNGYTITWQGACSGTQPNVTIQLTADTTCRATFTALPSVCPPQTICGTVTDDETGQVLLHGIPVILQSAIGGSLGQFNTGNDGKYAFGSLLTGVTYIVHVDVGLVAVPVQARVMPGGPPTNFTVRRVPANVTVTGPVLTLALFTKEAWQGLPPCQGGGCPPGTPVSISHTITGINPDVVHVPNGTWWLTCYVFPGFGKTSNQQLILTPQENLTISCPP